MGLGNFFGRLSSTMVVKLQKEVFSIHSLLAIVAGTCAALVTLCKSATEYYILATIYGFSIGPFVAMESVAIVQLIGPEKIGTGLGWTDTMIGLFSIIGPPIFGALLGQSNMAYQFYAAAGLYAFSSMIFVLNHIFLKQASLIEQT